MKKLVQLGKYYLPDVGGIEAVTSIIAQGAIKAGFESTVVCFTRNLGADIVINTGVRVLRSPIKKVIASQPLSFEYLKFSLHEARHADIVHIHAPNMLAALCSLFIGKKARLVVHWHGDILNKGFLGYMFKPLEVAMLKRAHRIVATSQIYADTSPALASFQSKVSIVPIGVPDVPNESNSLSKLGKLPLDLEKKLEGKKIILAVGRLVPFKGFSILIEAARHFDENTAVVIVGGGPMQVALQAAIVATGLTDRVHLVGSLASRLSNETLHWLFKRASLYCLPSIERSESFGVVLIEAMAYGIPCVVSDIPGSGVTWVNQHGSSGMNVPVGDAVALANACKRILSSPEEHARLSAGARLRFLSEFTEDVSVSKMLAVYELILDDQKTIA